MLMLLLLGCRFARVTAAEALCVLQASPERAQQVMDPTSWLLQAMRVMLRLQVVTEMLLYVRRVQEKAAV
jgi:hypothetical protein